MWSHQNVPFTKDYLVKIIGYWYHSVNVITFRLSQSDHIKPILLYFETEYSMFSIKGIMNNFDMLRNLKVF